MPEESNNVEQIASTEQSTDSTASSTLAESRAKGAADKRKIAFVVDSACDVSPAYVESHPTYIIPLIINYSDGSFLDRVNITPREVYDRFAEEIPSTSTPTPGRVHEVFDQVQADGFENVICYSISSGLSGTFDLVRSVAASYPNLNVEVVDTLNIGFACGMIAMHGMDLYDKGESFKRIVKKSRELVPNTHIYFVPDGLEYLYKGGRINKAVYSLGTVLNLCPVLTCNEHGKYVVAGKARGRKKSLAKGIELCKKWVSKKPYRFGVANGDAEKETDAVLAQAKELFPDAIEYVDGKDVSPALVVHTGPGLVGYVLQVMA